MINRYEWLKEICEEEGLDVDEVMDDVADNLGYDRDYDDDEDILRYTKVESRGGLRDWLHDQGII